MSLCVDFSHFSDGSPGPESSVLAIVARSAPATVTTRTLLCHSDHHVDVGFVRSLRTRKMTEADTRTETITMATTRRVGLIEWAWPAADRTPTPWLKRVLASRERPETSCRRLALLHRWL